MKTFLAVLGGAVVGAGAALLMAPQSGSATRSMIRDKSTKYGHDVSDFVSAKAQHLRNKAKGFAHETQDLVSRGKDMLHHGKNAIEDGEMAMASAGQDSVIDQSPSATMI